MRKQYRKCEKRVQRLYDKWWPLMALPQIEVTLRFHVGWANVNGNEDHDIVMTTSCLYEYREALIEVYLPKASTLKPKDLEHTFVHELCHVINAPIRNLVEDGVALETATENMAQALLAVYRA